MEGPSRLLSCSISSRVVSNRETGNCEHDAPLIMLEPPAEEKRTARSNADTIQPPDRISAPIQDVVRSHLHQYLKCAMDLGRRDEVIPLQ